MTALELEHYFLDQLTSGECYLVVGKGRASYRMHRGSFTTHDHIRERHKLSFLFRDGNSYTFGDGTVRAVVAVDRDPFVKFHFHVDEGFNRFTLRFKTFSDEHIYGCGEQYTHFDLKGQKVAIWVSEHQRVSKILKKFLREKLHGVNPDYQAPYKDHQTYFSAPSFVSSKNYAFYCHEDTYGEIDFLPEEVRIKFRQIPQSISLLTAADPVSLVSEMSDLIGHQPPLPSWLDNGVILAVQGGTEEVKKKYEEAKKAGVKIAAIWCQDWSGHVVTEFGYQVYWNWKVDETLYPNLKELIASLAKDGVRFLGYINTFLKEGTPLYNEAKKKGYLVRRRRGHCAVYLIKSTTFSAGIVDLTNPDAYRWYKELIKHNMIDLGLGGWMADFGEYLPTDCLVYGGLPEHLHNRWPSMWAKCCYEAVAESGKQNEIFYFSRAAYGHTIKYTNSMWNGDQHVDYSDEYGLGSVIPASLSMAYSGVGVVHSDVGGYTTILHMKRSAELFRRWSELALFFPVYRTHEGNRPKSNVQALDPAVLAEFARNSQLFLALAPYRKAVKQDYYEKGIPCDRPLSFYYFDERSAREKKEFLFGSELLVSPVLRPNEKEHRVYLPAGKWVQLFTNLPFEGGEIQVPSPLGLPLAFYQAEGPSASFFASLANQFPEEGK
jgi:sulfoquinovosidase